MKTNYQKIALVLAVGLILWFTPAPWDITPEAWHLFAIFFSAILAVLIDATSILLASLFALVFAVLTGTLTPSKAFSGFSESFMLMILAAFLVAKAVIKSGLGRRIALLLIRRFGSSTLRLGYCIFATDALIGPSIPSNTARSGILFPIVNALALDTGSKPDDGTRHHSGSYLMMCGIVSLTISSALWLTAMAANPVGQAMAKDFGVEMTFASWFLVASVPCIIAMIALPYFLYKVFPPVLQDTPEAQQAAANDLKKMGALSRDETITAFVFAGMILLWALAGTLNINLAIVAILGLAVLMMTGVYRLKDLHEGGGDALEVYIWFSILYVLSSALNEMGFMSVLGTQVSSLLEGYNWIIVYIFLTILYVAIHYLFVSQTAHMLALFAVFLEVGIASQVPAALMAFMLLFATNYFAAITPQASSCNAFFLGSGYLVPREVYKYGGLVTIVNVLIFLLATPWIMWASGL